MTSNALGDPPKLTHLEILEEKHARIYHVVDVLPRYQCVMDQSRIKNCNVEFKPRHMLGMRVNFVLY